MTDTIIICVFALSTACALVAVCAQFWRDLMMLQQNSYRNERYNNWLNQNKESTSYDRLIGLSIFFVCLLRQVPTEICLLLVGIYCLYNAIRLIRTKYKKPLVFTNRAKRIYSVALALVLVLGGIALFFVGFHNIFKATVEILLLAYCVSYAIMKLANNVLSPVEKHINKQYYNDAARKLASMRDIKVIGVTGSYGKTSTKHYLHRILSEKYDVLMTPGNFNTTLGVVRTIREHMKPFNEVFIVEMGAKQKGDIKEICDLVHPTIGIVTAVGPMHLESFGSLENVQSTKFELIDALPSDGLAVLNNDFDMIATREVDNAQVRRYAVEPSRLADYHASDIIYDAQGTTFTISDANGEVLTLHTKLVGECNISNLLAAVITSLHLGVEKDKIRYAVEKIDQVEHRLNMKRLPSGITIIDDAYNSNPIGSKMALDVLSQMTQGKRIVITPGMIELGDDQYELNKDLGHHIAESADLAIIVGEYNRKAITDGLKEAGFPDEKVHLANTFDEAQSYMLSISKPGDTVLYENDLPDTFK